MDQEIDGLYPQYLNLVHNDDFIKSIENYIKVLNFYKQKIRDCTSNVNNLNDPEIYLLKNDIRQLRCVDPLNFDCPNMGTVDNGLCTNHLSFFSAASASSKTATYGRVASSPRMGLLR